MRARLLDEAGGCCSWKRDLSSTACQVVENLKSPIAKGYSGSITCSFRKWHANWYTKSYDIVFDMYIATMWQQRCHWSILLESVVYTDMCVVHAHRLSIVILIITDECSRVAAAAGPPSKGERHLVEICALESEPVIVHYSIGHRFLSLSLTLVYPLSLSPTCRLLISSCSYPLVAYMPHAGPRVANDWVKPICIELSVKDILEDQPIKPFTLDGTMQSSAWSVWVPLSLSLSLSLCPSVCLSIYFSIPTYDRDRWLPMSQYVGRPIWWFRTCRTICRRLREYSHGHTHLIILRRPRTRACSQFLQSENAINIRINSAT